MDIFAVAGGGVHLQVAAHVGNLHEVRQAMFLRGFDFAGVFAQLGRNEIEFELGVDLFLGGAGHAALALERRQIVFVERVAHLDWRARAGRRCVPSIR
jgi:hypothetical protein